MIDFVVCNSTSLTDRLCCTVHGTVVSSSSSASVWMKAIHPASSTCGSIIHQILHQTILVQFHAQLCGIRARIGDSPVYLAVFDLSINVLPILCPVHSTHPHHFLNNSTEKTGFRNLS